MLEPSGPRFKVNTEVADVLKTDTGTELASPPATASSIQGQIQWLFHDKRNLKKVDKTAGTIELYDDAGTTVIATSTITDSGTLYTES